MTNIVRRAIREDILDLVGLMRSFYGEANYPLDEGWAAGAFETLLSEPSLGAVWLAFEGSEPAGYVVLTVRFSMEYGGRDAFVDDLFVRPEFRRRGVGRELLGALFAECATRNILAVHVEVGGDNEGAKSLYRSFGLREREDDRLLLTTRLIRGEGDL